MSELPQWFYSIGEQEKGPVDDDTLKQLASTGKLTLDSLVCHAEKTKNQWVQAGKVQGLNSLIVKSIRGTPETPIDTESPIDAVPVHQPIKTPLALKIVFTVLGWIFLMCCGVVWWQENSPEAKKAAAELATQEAAKEKVEQDARQQQREIDEQKAVETQRESELERFFRKEARKAVLEHVTHPRDASVGFPVVIKLSNEKYQASGEVDVQNAFGAKFNKLYLVTFDFDAQKNVWNRSVEIGQ